MSNVWVYKFDGTIQCAESRAIPIEEMRKSLELLIGAANVVSMKKTTRYMIQLCGMPTGAINTYEITPAGWMLLKNGISGDGGFQRLDEVQGESADSVNLGQLIGSLTASNPQTVQQLVGHPLRVYKTGDPLTLDWLPERCNIETSEERKIVKVWFG